MKDGDLGLMSLNMESGEWSEERIKEWQEYDQKIAEMMEELLQKARQKFAGNKGASWLFNEASNFGKLVRENNKDYSRYAAYHRLASSTTTRYQSPKLDLPKPYNVKDFCAKLMGELELTEDAK